MKGYESYREMQARVNAEGGEEAMVEFFLSLQIWGTPEQCYDKIIQCTDRCGADSFSGVFSYGEMDYAYAEQNMRTFAKHVMPALKTYQRRVAVAAE
jgi:alkanesulfonate monooxygenase SsuD/methylene tetrahydromethanopterin reductase-like flavin-dependent oxidoreductase (luciferase family)